MKKLNFSCGTDVKNGWDNCDIQKSKEIIYCDANKFPYPFKDNTYDYILLRECLYIFEKPSQVLLELWRICKNNAIIEIEVPYWNNKGSSTDIQTRYRFNEHTFINFVNNEPCVVNKIAKFKIKKMELTPTKVGRFIPKRLREKMALFISGLISKIKIELEIKK